MTLLFRRSNVIKVCTGLASRGQISAFRRSKILWSGILVEQCELVVEATLDAVRVLDWSVGSRVLVVDFVVVVVDVVDAAVWCLLQKK